MSVATPIDWETLAESVASDDPKAAEQLYAVLQTSFRAIVRRHLPDDRDQDRLHEIYIAAVEFIKAGNLREAERLAGCLKTITVRNVIREIRRRQRARKSIGLDTASYNLAASDTPEKSLYRQEQMDLMRTVLSELRPKDRDVLTRFYLLEQPTEQIVEEMHITHTQFRLLKSRAKTRFQELGRERLSAIGVTPSRRATTAAAA